MALRPITVKVGAQDLALSARQNLPSSIGKRLRQLKTGLFKLVRTDSVRAGNFADTTLNVMKFFNLPHWRGRFFRASLVIKLLTLKNTDSFVRSTWSLDYLH
ncbi:hypothetical protein B4900_07565 [Yersinia rohdei]|nr:hypothetical protein B4900_07565 [Yersinia rohdei]